MAHRVNQSGDTLDALLCHLRREDRAARLAVLRDSEIDLSTLLADLAAQITPLLDEYHDYQQRLRDVRREIAELVAEDLGL